MAITKEKKHILAKGVSECFGKSSATIVAEYRGISAEALRELRVELRKANGEFKIVKNRVAIKAIESSEETSPLVDKLTGPVGICYLYDDVAAGAKTLLKFSKENKELKVTGGLMEGKALSVEEIKAISDLPSKEELLSKVVGSIVAPHRGLLNVLNGVGTNLVRLLNAIKDTKS